MSVSTAIGGGLVISSIVIGPCGATDTRRAPVNEMSDTLNLPEFQAWDCLSRNRAREDGKRGRHATVRSSNAKHIGLWKGYKFPLPSILASLLPQS